METPSISPTLANEFFVECFGILEKDLSAKATLALNAELEETVRPLVVKILGSQVVTQNRFAECVILLRDIPPSQRVAYAVLFAKAGMNRVGLVQALCYLGDLAI